MVLSRLIAPLLAASSLVPSVALAQSIDSTAPMLDVEDVFGLPEPVTVGPFQVIASGEAGVHYDSNVYAEETDPVDDFVLVARPRLEARTGDARTRLAVQANAEYRKYFDQSSEDAISAFVGSTLTSEVSASDVVSASASWRRAVEDRGDPEARDIQSIGPRKINLFTGELGWAHQGPRVSLGLRGEASKIDYLSALDAERDLTLMSARASAGYRVGANSRLIVVGFVNQRNFDQQFDDNGINRDASTYGARAGLRFGEQGILRGEATLGVFRFDPSDPTLKSYTGLSADASLAYLPTRRLAFTLDAFRGDSATVRAGARARTDTTIRAGVQAEARHNLRLEASVFYRESEFRGIGTTEETVGVRAAAEYRINRIMSVVPSVTYADRTSDIPGEDFERFRGGVELRVRF